MISRTISVAALLLGLALTACNSDRKIDDGTLDSAGSTLQRGAEAVGGKLDTAFRSMKHKLNEAEVQNSLRQFRGLEKVDVALSDDSVATLTGVVASDADRRRAESLAAQMRDVRTVSNAIGVVADSSASGADTLGH